MRLLCDTQIIIWAMTEDDRLRPATAELITDRGNDVFFSIVSLWEVAIKVRQGRIGVGVEALRERCEFMGMSPLNLEVAHLTAVSRMTDVLHNDPFDHLLIAQAVAERVPLLTSDSTVQRYPIDLIKA
ncbi:MAG: hypothetical protein AVDCRST_MAG91-783 [uncultured Sphingomonadaceae bacterium]|uniref:PIN domain-containing protein n=1 Tax=uncultured Sphingomonadaceae bacterium TaxID=169976 RepID=A0A6J4SM72_9SPHN|nr:MAG: hypothetical protein AVDCRST_MAG91-783 [uncultured Sphingomonadaceae bacterium]